MEARRILVLVDGIHTRELLAELSHVLRPGDAELVLVYVVGAGPRAGLELVRRRPGGLRMPPHVERSVTAAERQSADGALAEAERLARPLAGRVRTVVAEGDAGRAMVQLATQEKATAVALRGGAGGLGPTGRFIAEHANCSVLVVR